MTTPADTATDVNDTLAEAATVLADLVRALLLGVGRSARWTYTVGELLVGSEKARKRAKRRRASIRKKREQEARARGRELAAMERERDRAAKQARAEYQREAAAEWKRQHAGRAKAERAAWRRSEKEAEQRAARRAAKARTTTATGQLQDGPGPMTPSEGQSIRSEAVRGPRTSTTTTTRSGTPHDPLRAGARTRVSAPTTPTTIRGVFAMAEAVDYESTVAALTAMHRELTDKYSDVVTLQSTLNGAGVGRSVGGDLDSALEHLGAAALSVGGALRSFQRTQGSIHELAQAAGGVGSNEFHGVKG